MVGEIAVVEILARFEKWIQFADEINILWRRERHSFQPVEIVPAQRFIHGVVVRYAAGMRQHLVDGHRRRVAISEYREEITQFILQA